MPMKKRFFGADVVARLRGQKSRPQGHSIASARPQASWRGGRLRDWHSISRDRRPALLSGQTAASQSEDVDTKKDFPPILYGITY